MSKGEKSDPSERRRRSLLVGTMALTAVGGSALDRAVFEHAGQWRIIDYVTVGALMAMATIIAVRATTSFGARNPVLNDELTRANRADAARWGFWMLMLTLLGVFLADFRWPLALADVAPTVFIAGAAAAGFRFAYLERQGA